MHKTNSKEAKLLETWFLCYEVGHFHSIFRMFLRDSQVREGNATWKLLYIGFSSLAQPHAHLLGLRD
jgi:hypothetical protein